MPTGHGTWPVCWDSETRSDRRSGTNSAYASWPLGPCAGGLSEVRDLPLQGPAAGQDGREHSRSARSPHRGCWARQRRGFFEKGAVIAPPHRIVVTDATVLINLIRVGRLDVVGSLERLEFLVPDDVREEITNQHQRGALGKAVDCTFLRIVKVESVVDLALFTELRARRGRGESACLALAQNARMDRAVRRERQVPAGSREAHRL